MQDLAQIREAHVKVIGNGTKGRLGGIGSGDGPERSYDSVEKILH